MADPTTAYGYILDRIPETQRDAARVLIATYWPRLIELTTEDILQSLRRIMAGDIDAVLELDAKLSDDGFNAKVSANTARWGGVAGYNEARKKLQDELALRVASVLVSILLALVGL